MATSSICSLMNHCMNCSPAKSPFSRATRTRSAHWSETRFSCSSARATGSPSPANDGLRRIDARDHDRLVGVEQVLDHDHRVVALLHGLAVEQPGELGEGVGVVVDGDRDVLLRGGEFMRDLLGELVGEAGVRHVDAA